MRTRYFSCHRRSTSSERNKFRITQEKTSMTIKIAALTLALVSLAPMTAMANKIDNRQAKQAERIEAGRQTGSITWTEGIKLRAEQRKIARTEAQLKADGYLSKSDKRTLTKMQNNASNHITAEKHDRLHRVEWLPRVGK
jgi:hypothetical protein